MTDAYEVCRFVRHYRTKNGYGPTKEMLACTDEFFDALIANGIVEALPIHDGGPPVSLILTDKGLRMATQERRRR